MINEKEKKYIYAVFAIAFVILIIVLIMIWSPLFTRSSTVASNILQYKQYSNEEYDNFIKSHYTELAKNFIDTEKFNYYVSYINEDFLDENNLTLENIYDYLVSNNLLINVSDSTVLYNCGSKNNGTRFIYSYIYKDVNGPERKIHFIEDYIGEYTVSFEQNSYPVLNTQDFTGEYNGLLFKLKEKGSFDESILLDVTIQNTTNEVYTFDIGSIDKVTISMSNGNIYKLNTIIAGDESSNVTINPGQTITFELSFGVDLNNQSLITSIVFNNVYKIDGTTETIRVDF